MSSKDNPERDPEDLDYPRDLEHFTFDEWRCLHEEDPHRFDRCRLKLLNDLIDAAPPASRPRLRGLMFRMEGESRRCKNPLHYNLRLSAMMMEMLDELRQQLTLLSAPAGGDTATARGADVIPFTRPGDAGRNSPRSNDAG